MKVKIAADRLQINYSTAKDLVRKYKKEGKIGRVYINISNNIINNI